MHDARKEEDSDNEVQWGFICNCSPKRLFEEEDDEEDDVSNCK